MHSLPHRYKEINPIYRPFKQYNQKSRNELNSFEQILTAANTQNQINHQWRNNNLISTNNQGTIKEEATPLPWLAGSYHHSSQHWWYYSKKTTKRAPRTQQSHHILRERFFYYYFENSFYSFWLLTCVRVENYEIDGILVKSLDLDYCSWKKC